MYLSEHFNKNLSFVPRVLVKCMLDSEVTWNKTTKIIGNIMERLRSNKERKINLNP